MIGDLSVLSSTLIKPNQYLWCGRCGVNYIVANNNVTCLQVIIFSKCIQPVYSIAFRVWYFSLSHINLHCYCNEWLTIRELFLLHLFGFNVICLSLCHFVLFSVFLLQHLLMLNVLLKSNSVATTFLAARPRVAVPMCICTFGLRLETDKRVLTWLTEHVSKSFFFGQISKCYNYWFIISNFIISISTVSCITNFLSLIHKLTWNLDVTTLFGKVYKTKNMNFYFKRRFETEHNEVYWQIEILCNVF